MFEGMMQEEGGSDPRVGGGQGWEGATALERDDQEEGATKRVRQLLGVGLAEVKKT
jgi:hypothetical protein